MLVNGEILMRMVASSSGAKRGERGEEKVVETALLARLIDCHLGHEVPTSPPSPAGFYLCAPQDGDGGGQVNLGRFPSLPKLSALAGVQAGQAEPIEKGWEECRFRFRTAWQHLRLLLNPFSNCGKNCEDG